jgi:hypothetical protein
MLMVRDFMFVDRELTVEELCMVNFLHNVTHSSHGYTTEYINMIKDCLYNKHGYIKYNQNFPCVDGITKQYGIFKLRKSDWREATLNEQKAYYYLKVVGCPEKSCGSILESCDDCIFFGDCIACSSNRDKCMMLCRHKEFKECE